MGVGGWVLRGWWSGRLGAGGLANPAKKAVKTALKADPTSTVSM